ncbi:hypothetical protein O7599_31805 [Streptomyces sp. WMMC500]|uniref:hypothetical protein n=1 Tax=Streptomyces sp. WMMC500 TaxID=3015154 RepID=UPI00248C0AB5|nr:hypothetical protein [Streptomyces sp. WMMC500]WBB60076.1 hypothetical protein O7599_31805 [Streptomyces sp. WMMC500]
MKVEELVRRSLHQMAESDAHPDPGLAGRVLRTRRRRRVTGISGAVASVAAVVAVAVAVPLAVPGSGGEGSAATSEQDVIGRPGESPPRGLIAAGDVALSAYHTRETEVLPGGDLIDGSKWRLYDPATGRYEETDWAWIDVAPGMRTAAVLEKDLPADRIGLLDLATGEVERWIPLDGEGVGSVEFSPDGERLLATAYGHNPDRRFKDASYWMNEDKVPGAKRSRTGFYVADVASGDAAYTALPYADDPDHGVQGMSGREDLSWSDDGELIWEHWAFEPGRLYYDLSGEKAERPAREKHVSYAEAGLSPNGRLVGGEFAGKGDEIASEVLDSRTGERVAKVPGQQLLAWADDERLIAWGCDPGVCQKNEFRNRLVLIGLDGEQVIPLSGARAGNDGDARRWIPEFTER